ncbi:hypothetical protein EB796_009979 [Bugula neritina]|uniref:CLPX n=1 Tax=Bugula neritina TaxID=10212 RepID=A0A7J7K0I4_BUGNE|nr:hypothetical protein EB796_009979 [Bugula neritina]
MRVFLRATQGTAAHLSLPSCHLAASSLPTGEAVAGRSHHTACAHPSSTSGYPPIFALEGLARCTSPTRSSSSLPASHSVEPLLLRRIGRYSGGGRSFGVNSGSGDSSTPGKGSGDGSGKDPPKYSCPKCGEPTLLVQFLSSSRYLKCLKCDHIFHCETGQSLSESEEINPTGKRKPPPPPKKIYEYLNKFVVGQERSKKVLSVAVYNHYKRVYNNIPTPDSPSFTSAYTNEALIDHLRHPKELNQLQGLSSALGPSKSSRPEVQGQGDDKPSGSDILDSDKYTMVLDKSNIVMLGPTGSGKTFLAQTLARCLDVPFAICDCTTLTQAGYVGEDVESVISKLLQDANGDVELAQQGIVFLDEIDKIGAVPGVHQLRDVGGEGVQQGMLKLIEGTTVSVSDKSSKKLRGESIVVDTTNILFIASGAFNGLDKIISKRTSEKFSGFGSPNLPEDATTSTDVPSVASETATGDEDENLEELKLKDKHLSLVEAQDLISYGMIPEFVGRFPILTSFHNLTQEMLVEILTVPKNALIPQFQVLFNIDKVALDFTEDALKEIAKTAQTRKTGARGLRAILENILLDTMFEVPGSDVVAVTVDKDAVLGRSAPTYTYSASDESDDSTSTSSQSNSSTKKKKAL